MSRTLPSRARACPRFGPRCPVVNSASCALERRRSSNRRKSLILQFVTGTRLDVGEAVDRELAPEIQSQAKRRTLARVGLPLLLLAVLIIWLPGWIRPSLSRARIRTAVVTAGPVESVIMASGTVTPEVERVLSSPLDARVLRLLQRPGAHLKRGDPVLELDVSE